MADSNRELEYIYDDIILHIQRVSRALTDKILCYATFTSDDGITQIPFREVSGELGNFHNLFDRLKALIMDLLIGEKTPHSMLQTAGSMFGEFLNHTKETSEALKPVISDRQNFDRHYKRQALMIQETICDFAEHSFTHPQNICTFLAALYISYDGKTRIYSTIEEIFLEIALLQSPKRMKKIISSIEKQCDKLRSHAANLKTALDRTDKPEDLARLRREIQQSEEQFTLQSNKLSLLKNKYGENRNLAVMCVVDSILEIALGKKTRSLSVLTLLDMLLSNTATRNPTIWALTQMQKDQNGKFDSIVDLCDRYSLHTSSEETKEMLLALSQELNKVRHYSTRVKCDEREKIKIFERTVEDPLKSKNQTAFRTTPAISRTKARIQLSG